MGKVPKPEEFRIVGHCDKDGTTWYLSDEFVKKKLGVTELDKREERRFTYLLEMVRNLQAEMESLFLPEMLEKIEGFVRDNPDCKTREFSTGLWREVAYTRARRGAFHNAFELLQARGRIIPTSHGPGKNRTWRVKEPGHK